MNNKTNLIFLHRLFKALGDSTILVFVPLYILKSTNDITLPFIYLLANSITSLILMLVGRKVIQKYGVIGVLLHFIPTLIAQYLLNFSTINLGLVIIFGVLAGITQCMYWIPLNLLFAICDKSNDVAKFQMSTNVGKLVFILISGLLLGSTIKNSFLYLVILATVFYVVCAVPIAYGYKVLKDSYAPLSVAETNNKHTYPMFNLFHVMFGMFQATIDNIIPLYLYINNLSFESVATVIALVELCKMCSNYISKILVSKGKQIVCVRISFSIFITCSILLITLKIPVVLYILSCVIAVAFPLTFVPLFKMFCDRIECDNYLLNGMTDRDIYIFIGKLPIYSIFFVIPSMYSCFGIGISATIAMLISQLKIIKAEKANPPTKTNILEVNTALVDPNNND